MKKWKERDVENHRAKGKITLGCGNPKCERAYCPKTEVKLPIRKVVATLLDANSLSYRHWSLEYRRFLRMKALLREWADHMQIPKGDGLRYYEARISPRFFLDGKRKGFEHSVGFFYDGTSQKDRPLSSDYEVCQRI